MFAHDRYTILTPELLTVAGSPANAIVLAHIHYRLVGDAPFAVEVEGVKWWPGTHSQVSEWTGLSVDQVRRGMKALAGSRLIEITELRQGGQWDRTKAYRVSDTLTDPPAESPDDAAKSPNVDAAKSPNVPYIENIEDIPARTDVRASDVADAFETFYAVYPRHVGKADALKAFKVVVKGTPADVVLEGVRRFAADPNLPEKRFIPHPGTWLRAGRWSDEPLPPRDGAQTAAPRRVFTFDD